jgi:hypothetical protein
VATGQVVSGTLALRTTRSHAGVLVRLRVRLGSGETSKSGCCRSRKLSVRVQHPQFAAEFAAQRQQPSSSTRQHIAAVVQEPAFQAAGKLCITQPSEALPAAQPRQTSAWLGAPPQPIANAPPQGRTTRQGHERGQLLYTTASLRTHMSTCSSGVLAARRSSVCWLRHSRMSEIQQFTRPRVWPGSCRAALTAPQL